MVSRCLSATGISLLGHPIPAGELGPPHGRLTGPGAGPRRGYRVPHARATTGEGALYTPGTTVLTPTEATTGRASAASQRPVPAPRQPSHRRGCCLTRPTRVHKVRPSGLPLACGRPDGTGRPWAYPSGFAPRRPRAGQRTPRWGQAIEHGPGTTAQLTSLDLQSGSSLDTCDLASHVAIGLVQSGRPSWRKRSSARCALRAFRDGRGRRQGAAPTTRGGSADWASRSSRAAPRRLERPRACRCPSAWKAAAALRHRGLPHPAHDARPESAFRTPRTSRTSLAACRSSCSCRELGRYGYVASEGARGPGG